MQPKLIGGKDAPYFIWGKWFSQHYMMHFSLEILEMKQVGDDIKIVAKPEARVTECLQEL